MANERNEVSYYTEIQSFIEAQLKSNFRVTHCNELDVYWGKGELKTNLKTILNLNPEKCGCIKNYIQSVPPLNLDIFAVITDGDKFELLILEVKLMNSTGLKEWSQLVGYCLVSGAKYGLLVNIDGGASPRLSHILSVERYLSYIVTIVNKKNREHCLGFMQWDSITQNFEYSNLGYIKSISALCASVQKDFN